MRVIRCVIANGRSGTATNRRGDWHVKAPLLLLIIKTNVAWLLYKLTQTVYKTTGELCQPLIRLYTIDVIESTRR